MGAMSDNVTDGLQVSTTFQATGGFTGMEAGSVFTDESVAHEESN
jgi:hypothetical protein